MLHPYGNEQGMAPASCWQAEVERGPLSCGTSSRLRISVCPQSSSLTTLRAGSEGEATAHSAFPLHLAWLETDEYSLPLTHSGAAALFAVGKP